jgi:AraC-like DNA-binding protein
LERNIIHIEHDYQFFIGKFDNNLAHKHYAIQLSIPLHEEIQFLVDHSKIITQQAFLIKPNVEHKLESEHHHLFVLLNPASTIGHFWNRLISAPFSEINIDPISQLRKSGLDFLSNKYSAKEFVQNINDIIRSHDCHCKSFVHSGDERIDKAIAYLKEHFARVIPMEEVSEYCHLSASRFLHLFKENTGITYRRAQLWSKLMVALPLMSKKSLTEVAHQVGFVDSAHLSRIFKENFGFSPKALLKLSQFIQV